MNAPPSMKSPEISSVLPGVMIGSPDGGPRATDPGQRGFTETVTTLALSPGRTLCVRIVWIADIVTAAPTSRNRQSALRALARAVVTVNPIIRGARHVARAVDVAPLGVPVNANGSRPKTSRPADHDLVDRFIAIPYREHHRFAVAARRR